MASKPEIRELARQPICPNCGGEAVRKHAKGPPPKFCTKKCKIEMTNRLTAEGRNLIAFAKAWRIDRGSAPVATASLAQMCEILDYLNAADHAAGRPRADLYAAKILADGTRFIDRRRGQLAPRIAANKIKAIKQTEDDHASR